ncbi:hypothetical protein F5883DRAFT_679732 [Diaporthe sp. PMI_573]|nr:hypothetical protein F5883DRAFT_679732 [Diaporthaceae sp. PMI_573]
MPVQDVRDSLQMISAETAEAIPIQLNEALKTLAELQHHHARLRDLQVAARAKSERIATYGQIIEEEAAAQQSLEAECGVLQKKLDALAADRVPFDFWASAFAQKSRRVSSAPSATSSYTFREFVREQSLAELNTVTTQILTILFEQSRHATALTTGMLSSLFVGDDPASAGGDHDTSGGAALDSSLSVDARLSYGKRSGGERKRIDLALFFALLYVGHARSPHRAHYMLVDEVFDSLDAAGQAAVVRWCSALAAGRLSYIVITTHSEALVPHGALAAGGEQEGGLGGAVLEVRMGEAGVELEMDGRSVG